MTNQRTITLVVAFLGAFGLLVVAGAIYLASTSKQVPDPLWTLAGTAIGALGSLLASTKSNEAVVIANEPNDPVPVENTGVTNTV